MSRSNIADAIKLSFTFGGLKYAIIIAGILLFTETGPVTNMVATVPTEYFNEVAIVVLVVAIITGLIVMAVRWGMHVEEKGTTYRGALSLKHTATGIFGMAVAIALTAFIGPLVTIKAAIEPELIDYQVFCGLTAFVLAIIFVAIFQFGFSKLKALLEANGDDLINLIVTGKLKGAQLKEALAGKTESELKDIGKKVAAAQAEQSETQAAKNALAGYLAEPTAEPVPATQE